MEHAGCKYLGGGAWDCGHIEHSEQCDCHVCQAQVKLSSLELKELEALRGDGLRLQSAAYRLEEGLRGIPSEKFSQAEMREILQRADSAHEALILFRVAQTMLELAAGRLTIS